MTMARIRITVEVEVDLEDYAQTYGIDEDRAEADAAGYLENIIRDAVTQQVGEFKALSWGECLNSYAEGV